MWSALGEVDGGLRPLSSRQKASMGWWGTFGTVTEFSRPPLGVGWDCFYSWHDQFMRMERWLERLLRSHSSFHLDDQDGWHEFWDIAFAFFQNAYHLKDWIVFEHPRLKKVTEQFIASNPNLCYCADICNGTKHREVTQGHRHRILGHLAGIREFAPDEPTRQRLSIIGPDGPRPVIPLAIACVDAWRVFITQQIPLSAHRPVD